MHRRNPPGTSNIRERVDPKGNALAPRVRSVLGEALHVRPYFLVVFDVTSHTLVLLVLLSRYRRVARRRWVEPTFFRFST